jgi:hypothetical protein
MEEEGEKISPLAGYSFFMIYSFSSINLFIVSLNKRGEKE